VKLVSLVVDLVRTVDNSHDLGVAHVKKGGAIGRRDDTDDSMQVAHLGRTTTIKAEAFGRHKLRGHGEGESTKGG
jgi:hypothetical protein